MGQRESCRAAESLKSQSVISNTRHQFPQHIHFTGIEGGIFPPELCPKGCSSRGTPGSVFRSGVGCPSGYSLRGTPGSALCPGVGPPSRPARSPDALQYVALISPTDSRCRGPRRSRVSSVVGGLAFKSPMFSKFALLRPCRKGTPACGLRRASFARNGLPSVAPRSRRCVCDEERRMVPKGGFAMRLRPARPSPSWPARPPSALPYVALFSLTDSRCRGPQRSRISTAASGAP